MPKPISRRSFLSRSASATVSGALAGVPPLRKAAAPLPIAPYRPTAKQIAAAYERVHASETQTLPPVLNANLVPHWFGENDALLWYRRDGEGGTCTFVLVNTETGQKSAAFDHARLTTSFSQVLGGTTLDPARLPFSTITLSPDLAWIRFVVRGQTYQCDLPSYVCHAIDAPPAAAAAPPPGPPQKSNQSPPTDAAFLKNHNVWARGTNNQEIALTTNGTPEKPFDALQVSPNGAIVVGFRKTDVAIAPVYLVESSPKAGWRGVPHEHPYAQPGDPFPQWEMWVFQTGAKTAFRIDAEPFTGEYPPAPIWQASQTDRFLLTVPDRGHQRFRVLEAEAASGKTRVVIDERAGDSAETFINTSNTFFYMAKNGRDLFTISERDGWRHLYRHDVPTGSLLNQVTQGAWVVRTVERVDEEAGHVYFWASGKNAGEDPYNLHLYRVGFDGTGLTELTGGKGSHTTQFSPTRRFLVDTASRPDMPPTHFLRRTDDGIVCPLETADVSGLQKAGWQAPEVFCAKGRDKQTDIWGLVFRPRPFDPNKRYPVIENIYAGPHDSFVRKTFAARDAMQTLADLGFIVVQCDGMGTRNRSKAFHDVCWRDLKDAGLPDRITWIRALAQKYPCCDVGRVGIYGTSAGGQNVGSALLFHGDFYKVGVASCGCHDNRIDKQWWNEQWMGYPVGPWYNDCSNIIHAAKLMGKLLLMVGELDTNVPPESTLRFADALIKAGKDFDLLLLPGLNHTSGGTYGERRRRDYFVRHLLGAEPPDRNAPRPPAPVVKPILLIPHPPTETNLSAEEGGGDTIVTFRNLTRETVQLFWLPGGDDGRGRVPYGTIAPGKEHEQHTFAGHIWLVVGANGRDLVLFAASSRAGIAEIKAAP